MNNIDIQLATDSAKVPSEHLLIAWCNAALQHEHTGAELTLRIVDAEEIRNLNAQYRHKDTYTNVLSFPCELPAACELNLLGDIIICASVVEQEAAEQSKMLDHHWAHMVIHGTLHLQGYDHTNDDDAEIMEALEITILSQFNIANPYAG